MRNLPYPETEPVVRPKSSKVSTPREHFRKHQEEEPCFQSLRQLNLRTICQVCLHHW
ncbi:hypothetical protein Q7C36_004246 [Tachysurus vachellii]|uniref:Uncharacterized protein n=1 Tax=Tachysurus vachellii TaxID=175792 RepID=A0AA88NN26_TACVA|nr:hypothetical protein Q7C36_004246 [Tachysurus vachellii]